MGDVFLPLLLFSLVGSDKSRCRNKSSALLKSTETLVGILFNGIECFNPTVRQYSFQREEKRYVESISETDLHCATNFLVAIISKTLGKEEFLNFDRIPFWPRGACRERVPP